MNGGLCSWRDKTCVPPWMFVFSYCISLLFHRSNRKVFVGTFVIPFKITLMCQICWKPCLPLGLKLVGWLFTEKIAGYDSRAGGDRVSRATVNSWRKNYNEWQKGDFLLVSLFDGISMHSNKAPTHWSWQGDAVSTRPHKSHRVICLFVPVLYTESAALS